MSKKKKISWDLKVQPHGWSDKPLTEKQLIRLDNWRRFSDQQGGIYHVESFRRKFLFDPARAVC